MSSTDPISDMFVRIKNAQIAKHTQVSMPSSRHKKDLAKLLHQEGYIDHYEEKTENTHCTLTIDLKYYKGLPVIRNIRRISKPGLRIYRKSKQLTPVLGGLGLGIVSTSKGLMSLRAARQARLGGEIIGEVC